MTMLDDDQLDQRLRRAGERLRHEAPGGAAVEAALVHVDHRPVERDRRRWVTPVAIATVAAAAVALFALVGRQDEAVEQVPADPPPRPVRILDVVFSNEDFDGDGGQCVEVLLDDPEVDAARGCMTGAQVRSGRPMVTSPESGSLGMVRSGTRVHHVGTAVLDGCQDDLVGEARFLDIVTCGEQPLFGVLPATDGDVTWTVRDAGGRSVELAPITVDGEILVFDVPSASDRPCLVIASPLGLGDWADVCSPLPTVRALTRLGGTPAVVGPLAASVTSLNDAAAATLGCPDLDGLLRRVGPAGGVTIRLSCVGDLAVAVQGSAELEHGRTGTYAFLLEHRASGPWVVVAEGPSLPCAPVRFCDALGPVDDLADAAAVIPRL